MAKKDELSEEHLKLLEEAESLGLDTMGYSAPNARLDSLREAIARQTQALAREAIAKRRVERAEMDAADEEQAAIRGAFDETMANTRGVLVRLVEWSEWVPVGQDEKEPRLTLANGVTGFEAGENERLLTVEAVGTQRIKHVTEGGLSKRFMLYAFKATLAQNVHTTMVSTLVTAQGSNDEGEVQKPQPPSGLITPDGPNRAQRRHG
jgi:predicted transcriptional regulator